MEKKRVNKMILLVIIITAVILVVACSTEGAAVDYVNLENAKYVLSFSGGLNNQSINSFSVMYRDGTIKEHPVNRSIVIANGLKIRDEMLFFSRQKNTHFAIANNIIQEFSFLEEKYEDAYVGVLFANESNGHVFAGVNVGFSDEGYLSELLYRTIDEPDYLNITFYDKILCTAVYKNETIYVQYLDLNKRDENDFFRRSGILEIDMNSQEIKHDYMLDNKYEGEPDRPMVLFGEEIILFRPALDREGFPTGASYLAVYSDGEIQHEKVLDDLILFQVCAFDNSLYLIDIFGKVRVLDSTYNLINNYQLESFEGSIKGAYHRDGELYVALTDEENAIKINQYRLNSGELVGSDPVAYPRAIEWHQESFTFLPWK